MAVPKKRKSKNATSIKKQCWKKTNENKLKNILTLYFKSITFPNKYINNTGNDEEGRGFGKIKMQGTNKE